MFKNIENKYRPIPFWSWNEKLDTEETRCQVAMMDEVGMGGFFMHARGGLETEYMSKEWFKNVSVSIDEASGRNMAAWAYDENGWPSGFGNGKINGAGIDFQQKYLRMEYGEKETDCTIANTDGVHFYYETNPFYVDTLNVDATNMFIKEIYEPYYEKYKNDIAGFFTDEPQISRKGIPWSFKLPEAYKNKYGEDLVPRLIELFKPVGNYENTRFRFWKLVTDMFSSNFMKPIYDWCDNHGLMITGHLVEEESLYSQLTTNGAVMPHYEYFHIPGIDRLSRPIEQSLTSIQVGSAAHQLGKKQVLSESFAMCGHNVSHNELKGIIEWQMVNGITLMCQHLQGYSLRGIRKRDYPPAMYYQQPWWKDYKIFNDSVSRIGMILSKGEVCFDTLVIHPQSSAWVCYDADKNEGLKELDDAFLSLVTSLKKKHILFHLGDETIMERHAYVDGDAIVIGTQRYKTIVMPEYKVLFDSTKKLLDEFKQNGGRIVKAEEIENNSVVSSDKISYTKREFDGFDVHYFVNSTDETIDAKISVGSKMIDIKTGEEKDFCGKYRFEPFDSLLVIDNGEKPKDKEEEVTLKTLSLDGKWQIKSSTYNSLTLDYCDYFFDDELIEKNGYILNIQGRACDLKRPVNIRLRYTVKADYIPKELYLVCETPEKFDISVNGKRIDKKICGTYADSSFKMLSIADYMMVGDNKIELSVKFTQSDKVYENLEKAKFFEGEKNKLTYDTEIEPSYIVGDFSVNCTGVFEGLEREAVRYTGEFVISEPETEITLKNIEQQGYPFFAGSITLEKEIDLESTDYMVQFDKKGINTVKISANGEDTQAILWKPYKADLSKQLRIGKNKIQITLVNNLRNLLGPHHLEIGESYAVPPHAFFKENCIWKKNADPSLWNDNYCFAETSIVF